MVIKKYIAKNMNEALTRIRYELGKDAIIISQRKIKKPGIKGFFQEKQIEVTAAIENSRKPKDEAKNDNFKESIQDIQRIMAKSLTNNKEEVIKESNSNDIVSNNKLQQEVNAIKELLNEVMQKNNGTAEEKKDLVEEILEKIDIDEEFFDNIKKCVDGEDTIENIKEVIKNEIAISDEEMKGNVVLVGPTGVGKTTTIAKLAGRLSLMENKKVGLITVDTYRIGAVEQLKTYAEIMNIPFKVVITIKEMEAAVESMKDCDVILIDTTGRSSKNSMQISELRAFVQKSNPSSVNLVISATTKNKDIQTIIDGYKQLNYKNVIITKLDETSTYGALYNIPKRAKKPITFITTGQNVPDDIKIPTKDDIIKFLFEEKSLC